MQQKRKYAAHFEYPDKTIKELGVVRAWVDLLEGRYHSPACGPHPNHAPDCVVLDRAQRPVGVEVCELVDRGAIEKHLHGSRNYKLYGEREFLSAVAGILARKASRKYHGAYAKLIVLIHTDEYDLTYERCAEWLRENIFFRVPKLAEAYIIFSYRPQVSYRYLRIRLRAHTFRDEVFAVVRRIPRGKTRTYREVAAAAGRPRAWRAVGNILNTNYDPRIPCHRVVRSDGRPGGWNRGAAAKRRLLEEERSSGAD